MGKIRQNVSAFMMSLFRQGAFQGTTPTDAFFVKCDGETTTANDRNLGVVNIEVGFAPLKPAEFVVITDPADSRRRSCLSSAGQGSIMGAETDSQERNSLRPV